MRWGMSDGITRGWDRGSQGVRWSGVLSRLVRSRSDQKPGRGQQLPVRGRRRPTMQTTAESVTLTCSYAGLGQTWVRRHLLLPTQRKMKGMNRRLLLYGSLDGLKACRGISGERDGVDNEKGGASA